jgi:hypothetical protein
VSPGDHRAGSELRRAALKDLPHRVIGVCGEHGGDPDSVHF